MGHGLRISNSGVATLRGNIIQGLSPGRTEIKVRLTFSSLSFSRKKCAPKINIDMSRIVCTSRIVNGVIWLQNFVKLSNYNIKLRTFYFLLSLVAFWLLQEIIAGFNQTFDVLETNSQVEMNYVCPFNGTLGPYS